MRDGFHAAGWTAHKDAHRHLACEVDRGQIAVGLEYAERVRVFRQLVLEILYILLHDRLDDGVGRRGHGPLVLLDLRQNIGRRDDLDVWAEFVDEYIAYLLLVGLITERIQQRDRDCLRFLPFQILQAFAEVCLVQLKKNIPVDLNALFGLDGALQRHERLGLGVVDPCSEAAWDLAPAHHQDVLVPFGDDKAGLCALALQHCVCACRGAMVDVVELAVPAVLVFQDAAHLIYALLHANGLIGRVCGHFGAYRLAVRGDNAYISEGADSASV
ncbi:hypothetical protein OPT61_g10559 [Boeremia exigua]|uniref:Uncharacterized protein n=1 Tax=Boeremia exigua TaxID=749465 RepID=A0ACC2HPA5_9PLEO|nr:hypothetical protein OPT61_g10559 [Boeremia exigua]